MSARPRDQEQTPQRSPHLAHPNEAFDMASMAATVPQQERLNFPLPTELREAIYSYLVGIKHDYLDEDWQEPCARAFHTQPFKINKTIRDEAFAYLYRTHQFVKLDYYLRNFESLAAACSLPRIIAPELKPTFDKHVLTINARIEDTSGLPYGEPTSDFQKGEVFLLVQDLPTLCEILRLVALGTRKRFIYINTPPTIRVQPHYVSWPGYTLHLKVQARDASPSSLSIRSQLALLESLRMIKGEVRISVINFNAAESTNTVIEHRFPSLIWLRAWTWDRLCWTIAWKKRLDQIMTAPLLDNVPLIKLQHSTVTAFPLLQPGPHVDHLDPDLALARDGARPVVFMRTDDYSRRVV